MTHLIDVRADFGAKGNGVSTDDGAALQAAFNAALAHSGDVVVRLQRGVYRSRIPLVIDAAFAKASSLVIDSDFAVVVADVPLSGPLLSVRLTPTLGRFRLSRLVLNGNGTTQPRVHVRACLSVTGMASPDHVVEHVVALWGVVGFHVAGGGPGRFRSCRASLCTDLGWRIGGTDGLVIDECAAVGNPCPPEQCAVLPGPPASRGHGFWIEPGAACALNGVHAELNGGFGILIGPRGDKVAPSPGTGSVHTPVSIVGGLIERNTRDGIFIDNVTGVSVRNCRMVGPGGTGSKAVFVKAGASAAVDDLIVSIYPGTAWQDLPPEWNVMWNA